MRIAISVRVPQILWRAHFNGMQSNSTLATVHVHAMQVIKRTLHRATTEEMDGRLQSHRERRRQRLLGESADDREERIQRQPPCLH